LSDNLLKASLYLKLHFIPSTYVVDKEEFGFVKNKKCWFLDSLVLTKELILKLFLISIIL